MISPSSKLRWGFTTPSIAGAGMQLTRLTLDVRAASSAPPLAQHAKNLASGQNDMADVLSFDLAIFLGGTLAAAFVTGLAGFAFGMVAVSIWLYALTPLQAS